MDSHPITRRELLVLSRRGATYWNRLAYGLIVSGLLMWLLILLSKTQSPSMVGRQLFMLMTMCLFGSALFSGVKNASDSLCVEKREGTLGFLFLTDLSGWDVVLGKLTASGLNAMYTLLACCPVLAVVSLLGGIGAAELAYSAVLCVNTLFLSQCVGLLASSLLKSERACASFTVMLLMLLSAYPGLIAASLYALTGRPPESIPWPYLAPWYPLFKIGGGFMNALKLSDLLTNVLLIQLVAWSCLGISSWHIRRSWQEFGTLREKARPKKRAGTSSPFHLRDRLLSANPIQWLALRKVVGHWVLWAAIAFAAGIWIYGLVKFGNDWRNPGVYAFTGIVLHLVFKAWIASEAGRIVFRDKQSFALELILGTPLSVREFIRGQHQALWVQARWPFATLLLADAWFIFDGAMVLEDTAKERGAWIISSLVVLATFISDLVTLAWVSIWTSLKAFKVNQGPGSAIGQVVILPSVIYFGVLTLMAVYELFNFEQDTTAVVMFLSWPCFFLGWNLIMLRNARRKLLLQFRAKALERAQAPKNLLGQLRDLLTMGSTP